MANETEPALERLLAESVRGDTTTFKKLYELLQSRVFAYVRSRITTHDDALDVTQQVFIELWKSLPRFTYQSDAAFYGFLFTIVKRQLVRVYRGARNESVALDNEAEIPDGEIDRGEHDVVMRALKTLDETSREIVVLHHWSRYTFGEIGGMLSMTESAVRVRHHRALLTLRTTLGGSNKI